MCGLLGEGQVPTLALATVALQIGLQFDMGGGICTPAYMDYTEHVNNSSI
jgi:hypothetical protein